MGFEKIKRPILAPGADFVVGASTTPGSVSNDVVVGADIRAGGVITVDDSLVLASESVTLSTAAKTLSADPISFITYGSSGKASDMILPDPTAQGQIKYIYLINNTTSVEANLNTAATAHTFWGTTFNTATISGASTGSPGGTPAGTINLTLIAQSTTQWAVVPGSTFNWDFSASTGSTATA